MPTSISIGIAIGFILASLLSANRVRFGLVRLGAWGLIVLMPLMALSRPAANHADGPAAGTPRGDAPAGGPTASTAKGPDGAAAQAATSRHLLGYRGSQMVLALMGICAGLFALPVQVFMQSRPPEHLKGRVIGTMNLINWIAMIASAGFYEACLKGLQYFGLPMYGTFAAVAVLLVPVALFYRPKDVVLA
jgi:acyl-[acyl-carrier-protein]-phospholipid O-acyltransferase/long-chain-fatty-acid--[acyl-carrier-protein] ligase